MAERGQYRSIHITLFDGKDFRALPSDARWVFVLLKCNLGYSGIAVRYRDELPHRLVGQSGLSLERVQAALDKLEMDVWLRWQDNIIWLIRHLEFEPNLKPADKKHRKGLHKHLAGLPRQPIVAEFIAAHPEWCPKGELRDNGLAWAIDGPYKGLPSAFEAKRSIKEKDKGERKEDGGSAGVLNEALAPFGKLIKQIDATPDSPMLINLLSRFNADAEAGRALKVIGEVAGALDGMHGSVRTWPELRTNIGDYLINPGVPATMAALRAYLYRDPDTARNGAKPTAGERAFKSAGNALRNET